jgi:hypothetical protein
MPAYCGCEAADERIGLTHAVARVFADARRGASVTHDIGDLLRQRLYALCCGWEDVTDHNTLRHDLALLTAVGRTQALASGSTRCRLEAAATPAHTAALHGVPLQQCIASRADMPQELVLDIDATHVPLHGNQEKAHFHRYYDNYSYLPHYVFCGQDVDRRCHRAQHPARARAAGIATSAQASLSHCRSRIGPVACR